MINTFNFFHEQRCKIMRKNTVSCAFFSVAKSSSSGTLLRWWFCFIFVVKQLKSRLSWAVVKYVKKCTGKSAHKSNTVNQPSLEQFPFSSKLTLISTVFFIPLESVGFPPCNSRQPNPATLPLTGEHLKKLIIFPFPHSSLLTALSLYISTSLPASY